MGPASIPIIWSLVLIVFSLAQIRGAVMDPPVNYRGRISLVLQVSILMTLFVFLLPLIGFFLATTILLVGGMAVMNGDGGDEW